jgi:hypothetical protein
MRGGFLFINIRWLMYGGEESREGFLLRTFCEVYLSTRFFLKFFFLSCTNERTPPSNGQS